MGINGLLPALKSITKPVHVSQYRGKTVAVDGEPGPLAGPQIVTLLSCQTQPRH